jgi:hypothetical protein
MRQRPPITSRLWTHLNLPRALIPTIGYTDGKVDGTTIREKS